MKKFFITICAAALLMTGCGGNKTVEQPAPPAQAEQKNFYSNGEFKIGTDLPAGEYIAVGTGYVELTKNADDGKRQIIVNANLEGTNCYFDVRNGEYIKVMQDVKLYPSASAPALKVGDTLPSGHYKIGSDAQSGEYKITLQQGGYFEVTTNLRHEGIYIVKNEFTNEGGSFYATVLNGQYLQIRKGTAEFVGATKSQVAQPVQQAAPAPPAAPAKVLNLGMTLEQFKLNFASAANQAGLVGLNIDRLQRETGNVQDIFSGKFSDTMAIQGAIDKSSGLVKEVWLLSQPQISEEMTSTLLTYATICVASNPNLKPSECGALLTELKLNERIGELAQENAEAVRGNVRYTAILMPNGILQLIAAAKDI